MKPHTFSGNACDPRRAGAAGFERSNTVSLSPRVT